jgi:IS5 family transposase
MLPRERRETGEPDLFRSRLDQIIDRTHALVKLSRAIDWRFLEAQFGSVYSDGPRLPALADAADGRLRAAQAHV